MNIIPIALGAAIERARSFGILEQGDPKCWNEECGQYEIDFSDPPEHFQFYMNGTDTFRIYTDGRIEEYDNREIDLAELERRAIATLSALTVAYDINSARNG